MNTSDSRHHASNASLPSTSPASTSTSPAIDVSVLIVNYNTAYLLDEMWTALQRARADLKIEVIVVDNASRDDSVTVLQRDFQDAKLVFNETNVGFGRANNQALRLASGRYVLLLNTDAFMAPDTLVKTVEHMDAHPDCGIVGVKLVGRDGTPQPSCRHFPTPWNIFLLKTGLSRFFSTNRMIDDDAQWGPGTVHECDWVPGCYFLVRRALIDQIGLFDPRYFLYYEELDHCYWAKQAGWKVMCLSSTSVIHIGGESAKSDAALTASGRQIQVLQIESELLYFRKNAGVLGVVSTVLLSTLADCILLVKHLLKNPASPGWASYMKHAATVWRLFRRTQWGRLPTR